jgi:hypothetical protein
MTADPRRPRNFAEFWPTYLREHRNPSNRHLHVLGTGVSFLLLGLAAVTENPFFLLGGIFVGYGCAWIGHFFIEHNRPATFRAPFFSLIGDWRMFYLTVNGKMKAELERLGLNGD